MNSPSQDSPADLWDQALAFARRQASTTTSKPSSSRLTLRREPKAEHLPHHTRAIDQIASGLLAAVRQLVRGELPWPLFAYGPPGTGKTCAALALCDWTSGASYFTTASGWAADLIEAGKGNLSWRAEAGDVKVWPKMLRERVGRAALVVLDELATRDRVSDWHYEAVKDLIDLRQGRPLVVLSNLNLITVERVYDDRIADRLSAGTIVALVGASRRREAGRTPPASATGQA